MPSNNGNGNGSLNISDVDKCMAHSGMNAKINILLVLSSVATILLGITLPMLTQISSNVAANKVEINYLKKDADKMETRLDGLEHIWRTGE
jgi:hypothetical protein